MSAAAVTAVRPGSRLLFSRASAPAAPVTASIGFPRAKLSGGTSRREKGASPKKSSTAPVASSNSRGTVARPPAAAPSARTAVPARIAAPASTSVARPSRDGGRTAPSRTAAIGGTRVARMAGSSVAARVTSMPAARLTATVRQARTIPALGNSSPAEVKSAIERLREREPAGEPDERREQRRSAPPRAGQRPEPARARRRSCEGSRAHASAARP